MEEVLDKYVVVRFKRPRNVKTKKQKRNKGATDWANKNTKKIFDNITTVLEPTGCGEVVDQPPSSFCAVSKKNATNAFNEDTLADLVSIEMVLSVSNDSVCAPQTSTFDDITNIVATIINTDRFKASEKFSVKISCPRLTMMPAGHPQELYKHLATAVQEKTQKSLIKKPQNDTDPYIFIDVGPSGIFIAGNVRDGTKKTRVKPHQKCPSGSKLVLFKWGELYLKGGNRDALTKQLQMNLKRRLGNMAKDVILEYNLHFVVIPADETEETLKTCVEICTQLPGCTKAVVVKIFPLDAKIIGAGLTEELELKKGQKLTLSIRNRAKNIYPKTHIFLNQLRTAMSDIDITDRLYNDHSKHIELFLTNDKVCYLELEEIQGFGGLPIMPGQSVVSLLSGGQDSPVAAYMMMKRGSNVHLVHFQNSNAMEQEAVVDKIQQIARHIAKFQNTTRLYIVPFAKLQRDLIEQVPAAERMLVYRRFMTKIASAVAKNKNSPFLVTGDSFSQVASQTIRNLEFIYKTSECPILAPLMGMDKGTIMAIGEKIGTKVLSDLPYGDCCSFFMAKNPALHLRGESFSFEDLTKNLDVEGMCKEALDGAMIMNFWWSGRDLQEKILKPMNDPILKEEVKLEIQDKTCFLQVEYKEMSKDWKKWENQEKESDLKEEKNTKIDIDNNNNNVEDAKLIYLDNAATTSTSREVVESMFPHMVNSFGNPNSSHSFGKMSLSALEQARSSLADSVGCKPAEIFFTSGGTESNNMIIEGVARAVRSKGHMITTSIEHASILEPMKRLKSLGWRVSIVPVDKNGFVNLTVFENHLKASPTPTLISVVHGNNEIATVQDLSVVSKLVKRYAPNAIFHTDACQSFAKVGCKVDELGVDAMTLNGHKIRGPKGVGALYIRASVIKKLKPFLLGGGQESGMRGGTVPVHNAVGLATAASIAMKLGGNHMRMLSQRAWELLKAAGGWSVNGPLPEADSLTRLPHVLNVVMTGNKDTIDGAMLLSMMSRRGVCASSGSACSAQSEETSHVLKAIGLNPQDSRKSIRLSFAHDTKLEDVERGIEIMLLCRKEGNDMALEQQAKKRKIRETESGDLKRK